MPTPDTAKIHFKPVDHTTWKWKVFLVYDMIMMFLIVLNLLILGVQVLILSGFGAWLSDIMHIEASRSYYIDSIAPMIDKIDQYFIIFLITELMIRWTIAIIGKHHRRWFFFPFIHWYEVLAIIPQLRFLRLLRAGVIAYRLHQLGYKVIPSNLLGRGKFYYELVMEELTSRIVLTVIDSVEKELDTSSTHHHLIHELIDQHRKQFAVALAEILQNSVASSLQQQRHVISQNIGQIVHKSIEDTPELKQLLRLLPVVGSLLEQQIQSIGQRLAENITQGIIDPLAAPTRSPHQDANILLTDISDRIANTGLNSEKIDILVESIVRDSLETIRKQVKIKHWQQLLDESMPPQKSTL